MEEVRESARRKGKKPDVKMEFLNMKTEIDANSLVNLIIPFVTAGMKA